MIVLLIKITIMPMTMMTIKVSKDRETTKVFLRPRYRRSPVIGLEAQFFIKEKLIEVSKDITLASHRAKLHVPFINIQVPGHYRASFEDGFPASSKK